MLENEFLDYAGTGIAMVTLIESTVRVTIRHSESPPIAMVAARASVTRDEATWAERLTKPAAPGDRIMAVILQRAGESPATSRNLTGIAGKIAAQEPRKWQKNGKTGRYARYSGGYARNSRGFRPRRRGWPHPRCQ
jgi:hypothetical protein